MKQAISFVAAFVLALVLVIPAFAETNVFGGASPSPAATPFVSPSPVASPLVSPSAVTTPGVTTDFTTDGRGGYGTYTNTGARGTYGTYAAGTDVDWGWLGLLGLFGLAGLTGRNRQRNK